MFCSQCGASNDPKFRFCIACGVELSRPLPAETVTPPLWDTQRISPPAGSAEDARRDEEARSLWATQRLSSPVLAESASPRPGRRTLLGVPLAVVNTLIVLGALALGYRERARLQEPSQPPRETTSTAHPREVSENLPAASSSSPSASSPSPAPSSSEDGAPAASPSQLATPLEVSPGPPALHVGETRLTEFVTCSGVDEQGAPTSACSTFGSQDTFFVAARAWGLQAGTRVSVHWQGPDGATRDEDLVSDRVGDYYVWFNLAPPGSGWSPGAYRAALSCDGVPQGEVAFCVGTP